MTSATVRCIHLREARGQPQLKELLRCSRSASWRQRFRRSCALPPSAYMAFHDKAQWKYFAAFAFLAGYGGIYLLYTIGAWRLAAHG